MRSKQKERAAAVAARKQEADGDRRADDTRRSPRGGKQIAASSSAGRWDAARAKKDAKLRRKAAKVEEAVMDWPARLWAWCRNNLDHYGYFKSIWQERGRAAAALDLREPRAQGR